MMHTETADRVDVDHLLVVYYKDGSSGHCLPSCVHEVEKALEKLAGHEGGEYAFSENPDNRDTLLRLTAANGDRLIVLASALVGCSLSTRESRRRRALTDRALDIENADVRESKQPQPDSHASAVEA